MRKIQTWAASGCLLCLGVAAAVAATRHPGLWELTTTMTWQKAPPVRAGAGEPLRSKTHTTRVCLTEEMIDKYGALLPQSRGQCRIENKVVSTGTVKADYVCTGTMNGKGDLVSNWSDTQHSKSSVHFVGAMRVGSDEQPIEWTTESNAVFVSADCGALQPPPLSGPK